METRRLEKKSGGFSSTFGFVMASAGAAVGLGNIWGFSYRLGEGGGFLFLALYLLFIFVAGYPLLYAELCLGQRTGKTPVFAYRAADRRLGVFGLLSVLCCFLVLCYYCYFGGLILQALAAALGWETASPLLFQLLFVLLTALVVLGGVSGGIEKCAKLLMPLLILLLAALALYALRLPGAGKALRFLFLPAAPRWDGHTLTSALTQVFFSFSLGQGCMLTYGSYLRAGDELRRSARLIPLLDTLVALLAALVIMPAVFSFDLSPALGPELMFRVMPLVFDSMRGGTLLAALFYLLVLFAALTSSVSMLEVPVASLIEWRNIPRRRAVWLLSAAALLGGLPLIPRPERFALYEFLSQNLLMTLCSLATCFAVLRMRKKGTLPDQDRRGSPVWFCIRYVAPALLLWVLLTSLFGPQGLFMR